MKHKIMRKGAILLLVLAMTSNIFITLMACKSSESPDSPDSLNSNTVEYTDGLVFEIADGYAAVTGYTGTDTKVIIPDTYNSYPVTAIGSGAFRMAVITSLTMPDSVLSIGDEAMIGCDKLAEIVWSQQLESIGTYCFADCLSLVSLDLPDSLYSLGIGCFSNCAGIKTIHFPKNLTVIPSNCFEGCSGLESITIPPNIKEIEYHAFLNTTNLKDAHVISGPSLCSVMGFSENTTVNISYEVGYKGLEYELIDGKAYVTGYTYIPVDESAISVEDCSDTPIIPYIYEGCPVVGIADGAFSGEDCKHIRKISISYGLTEIGAEAFSGCSNLTRMDIPTSLNNISPRAFDGCGDETVVMSYESEYLLMYFADKDVEYHQHGEYSFG